MHPDVDHETEEIISDVLGVEVFRQVRFGFWRVAICSDIELRSRLPEIRSSAATADLLIKVD